jgi:hypothetical protein
MILINQKENALKNFEIPANEISLLPTSINVLEMENQPLDENDIGECDDIFPATWKIASTIVRSYFASKNIPIENLRNFNSEGDIDDAKFPVFGKLTRSQWGFSDDNPTPFFDSKSDDDLYFEYGWSANYTRIYEFTINGKPALMFDVSDGTSSTIFEMLDIIFAI